MLIYIITRTEYDTSGGCWVEIDSAFKDKEKAKEYVKKQDRDHLASYDWNGVELKGD